jgi:hypothetical protein
MPSSYQVVLWKQESFLVLGQLTPGLNASKTKELPPDSIRIIECRLLLQTLMTPTVSKPRCVNFLEMSR